MLRYRGSDISLPRQTAKKFSCWLKRNEVRLHRFETAVCLTWFVTTDLKALSRKKRTQKHLCCEKILQVERKFFATSSELDRFAAQSRVGCSIAISDHFVLCWAEMLHCRIVKSLEARRHIFRLSLNVKYRQIRDKSVLIIRSVMEDFVSWFCAVEKVNFEKACWRIRDHGPFTKTMPSARHCLEFFQSIWE